MTQPPISPRLFFIMHGSDIPTWNIQQRTKRPDSDYGFWNELLIWEKSLIISRDYFFRSVVCFQKTGRYLEAVAAAGACASVLALRWRGGPDGALLGGPRPRLELLVRYPTACRSHAAATVWWHRHVSHRQTSLFGPNVICTALFTYWLRSVVGFVSRSAVKILSRWRSPDRERLVLMLSVVWWFVHVVSTFRTAVGVALRYVPALRSSSISVRGSTGWVQGLRDSRPSKTHVFYTLFCQQQLDLAWRTSSVEPSRQSQQLRHPFFTYQLGYVKYYFFPSEQLITLKRKSISPSNQKYPTPTSHQPSTNSHYRFSLCYKHFELCTKLPDNKNSPRSDRHDSFTEHSFTI